MDTTKVTRLELIDHTPCKQCNGERFVMTETDSAAGQSISFKKECPTCGGLGSPGRTVLFWDAYKSVKLSLQDDGKTLKVFVDQKSE